MLDPDEARRVLAQADQVWSADEVAAAVRRLAQEITAALAEANPLVLSVMGGAVVFTGQLLPLLDFPLDFDTLYVSRYRGATRGGSVEWRVAPPERTRGRSVLVLDDILDEGETMAAVRERLLEFGAAAVYVAVLADKDLQRAKPLTPDFTGLKVPDRYVFGYGMDVHGAWRNLPAIYALAAE
ncbi:MAG TPA: hypoxanthine-guanine phosphoribosyltransferase [Pelomicrobium sp.]|nr:hypoxanthine-guanine phosphoribosyltransferase [Pelomicrobium sp.]